MRAMVRSARTQSGRQSREVDVPGMREGRSVMSIAQFFGDGMPHDQSSRFDSKSGKIEGWTKADFINAVNVHQRAFGARYTDEALFTMFGCRDVTKVPTYAYGAIIGALAAEMAAGLPHAIPRGPKYMVKEQ